MKLSGNSSIISRDRIEAGQGESAVIPVGPSEEHPQPGVNVIRDGNIVRAIEVTCDCGKTTRIICNY